MWFLAQWQIDCWSSVLFLHCDLAKREYFVPTRKTMDWWGRGGNAERALKKRFHIFLKSPMLEKPISFLRKISVLPKVYATKGPTDWKHKCVFQNTNVFCQSKRKSVLIQNTFVFCHMPDNCYCICTYCYANNSKYYERWPPPTSAAPSGTVGIILAPPFPRSGSGCGVGGMMWGRGGVGGIIALMVAS